MKTETQMMNEALAHEMAHYKVAYQTTTHRFDLKKMIEGWYINANRDGSGQFFSKGCHLGMFYEDGSEYLGAYNGSEYDAMKHTVWTGDVVLAMAGVLHEAQEMGEWYDLESAIKRNDQDDGLDALWTFVHEFDGTDAMTVVDHSGWDFETDFTFQEEGMDDERARLWMSIKACYRLMMNDVTLPPITTYLQAAA
jgi:hypothetical protein